ncbi:hypothetical protein [Emcibacter sp.]|uniref:calcium-binding protein n=1 Tax=Emcibacter sp. TaxID=1979954 RepID=UPI002AA6CAAD|nr:hypothetical protein [Emcibacter sp.]
MFTNGTATVLISTSMVRTGEFLAEPDFIEGPVNTYTAINDSDAIMSRFFVDDNLTVVCKAGDDTIETGSGNDTIDGGDGKDSLYGDDGNDVLVGGIDDDYLVGGKGTDILDGGDGNDALSMTYYDVNLNYDDLGDSFDGGTGEDKIYVRSSGAINDLDLSVLDIVNIEILRIIAAEESDITFTVQDILDVTDADNVLVLQGDAQDTFISTGEGWVQGADQLYDGVTYDTYTSGGATLLVDQDVTFTI